MTGRAERDQVRALMHPVPPVMHMRMGRTRAAALTGTTVALQNRIAVPGKPAAGVLARGPTQDGLGEAIRAEENVLISTAHGQPVYLSQAGNLRSSFDNIRYHKQF